MGDGPAINVKLDPELKAALGKSGELAKQQRADLKALQKEMDKLASSGKQISAQLIRDIETADKKLQQTESNIRRMKQDASTGPGAGSRSSSNLKESEADRMARKFDSGRKGFTYGNNYTGDDLRAQKIMERVGKQAWDRRADLFEGGAESVDATLQIAGSAGFAVANASMGLKMAAAMNGGPAVTARGLLKGAGGIGTAVWLSTEAARRWIKLIDSKLEKGDRDDASAMRYSISRELSESGVKDVSMKEVNRRLNEQMADHYNMPDLARTLGAELGIAKSQKELDKGAAKKVRDKMEISQDLLALAFDKLRVGNVEDAAETAQLANVASKDSATWFDAGRLYSDLESARVNNRQFANSLMTRAGSRDEDVR